jgi:hypothetical protein
VRYKKTARIQRAVYINDVWSNYLRFLLNRKIAPNKPIMPVDGSGTTLKV